MRAPVQVLHARPQTLIEKSPLHFTWPMMDFAGVFSAPWMQRAGKLYSPRSLKLKSRTELLASIRPGFWKFLRSDAGGVPFVRPSEAPAASTEARVH